VAGNWLFSGRRWRNPQNSNDRAALIAGYDELVATFPVFSRCSRDRFLVTIYSFWSSWSLSTRHNLPDPQGSYPTPNAGERPQPRGEGSTGLGLERGSLQVRIVACVGRTHNPLYLHRGFGGGRFVLDRIDRAPALEVSRVCLDRRRCPHLMIFVSIAALFTMVSRRRFKFRRLRFVNMNLR
jgi:hypothetical protein